VWKLPRGTIEQQPVAKIAPWWSSRHLKGTLCVVRVWTMEPNPLAVSRQLFDLIIGHFSENQRNQISDILIAIVEKIKIMKKTHRIKLRAFFK